MTEADLWTKIARALSRRPYGFGVRLETARTGIGIPDSVVQMCTPRGPRTAWVELKIAFGNARPDVEGAQAGFGVRAKGRGHRAVVAAARAPDRVAIWELADFAPLALDPSLPVPPPEWEGLIDDCLEALLEPSVAEVA